MGLLEELNAKKGKLNKTSERSKEAEIKETEKTFSEKKASLGKVAVKSKKLEIVEKEVFQKEIDDAYKECQNNTRPLEKLKNTLQEDLLFITNTLNHLNKSGKLTPQKELKYNKFKENLQARKLYVDKKIAQFKIENSIVLEQNTLRDNISRKLDDITLEDAQALKSMFDQGKAISSMVITETGNAKDAPESEDRSALLSAIQGFNKGKLRKTSHQETSKSQKPDKKPELSISQKLGSMKNPYEDILELRERTAELKLNLKTTKELKDIKIRITDLSVQLMKEISFAKKKGVNKEIIDAKQAQIHELGKVSKVANNMIADRREADREKSDIVSVIKKHIEKLNINDLSAMNRLLGNIGNGKLSEMIDKDGKQQYKRESLASTKTTSKNEKNTHLTEQQKRSKQEHKDIKLAKKLQQEESDYELALTLQKKEDKKLAKKLDTEEKDEYLAHTLQEKQDRKLAESLGTVSNKTKISHKAHSPINKDNIPYVKNTKKSSQESTHLQPENFPGSFSILQHFYKLIENIIDLIYPKVKIEDKVSKNPVNIFKTTVKNNKIQDDKPLSR
ncbi:hypothetical protein H1Q59_02750 [Holosporaceae bacterium 'Namur']|nr:hypothetical protein [Holosporaceae bacterium 'Namur']